MEAPENLVYSTAPQLATDTNAKRHCIKGHQNIDVVLAELVGHGLAEHAKVKAPCYAVGRFASKRGPYFCSNIVENCIRDVEPHLKQDKIADPLALSRIVLLDIWLANNDRNIGNLLGIPSTSSANGAIELIAIDYEKSLVVRSKAPLIEIPSLPPKSLWPRGILGTYCLGKAALKNALVEELQAIPHPQIEAVVRSCFAAANHIHDQRQEMVVETLIGRQKDLHRLAKVEWN